MTARVLRVALIANGRIIEDRTFENRRRTVSVGSEPSNTFCVPIEGVPSKAEVFSIAPNGTIRLNAGSHDGLLTRAGAEVAWPRESIVLDASTKGRLRVGEVTVLFQLVVPPVPQAVPELPKGARGLTAQLDRTFMAALALSFAANLAGAGYVLSQPTPQEPEFSLAPEPQNRFAVALPALKPPPPTETEPALPSGKEKEVAPSHPRPKPPNPGSGQSLNQRVAQMGMLALIGSKGPGGAVGDLLKDANTVGNVEEALRGAQTVTVASAGETLRRKGDGTGTIASVERLGTDGAGTVQLREASDHVVKSRFEEGTIEVDRGDLPQDELGRWLRSRRSAIQSCYERELKRDRTLKGRLVLAFSVTPRGRVDELDFSAGSLRSSGMESCIASLARNWVLPFAPKEDVHVEFPLILSPVN